MAGNIYEKMNAVKLAFQSTDIKKTGKNKHSGFEYYELSDIQPTITRLCSEHKLFMSVYFTDQLATLCITDTENPESCLVYTSPMRDIKIAGCNEIQSLGGVETYQRRYLLLMAFDITEPDLFDSIAGSTANKDEMISQEQIAWLNANADVPAMLAHLRKGAITDLTKVEASALIAAKKRQLESKGS